MSIETQSAAERINLVYRSSSPSGSEDVELPFRLLVLGGFSGGETADYFDAQEPININKENFSNVLSSLSPSVHIVVDDELSEQEGETLEFQLTFNSLADFSPKSFVSQSPLLSSLIELRNGLLNLRENGPNDLGLSDYLLSLDQEGNETKFLRSMCDDGENLSVDMLDACICELDECLGLQIDTILHHEDFKTVEALWRSLDFLVSRTNFSENCIIEILNVSKMGLTEDLEDAPEVVQSQLHNIVYSKEFGQFGGRPYTCLLGAYSFGPSAPDVWLLQQIACVAAMAHAPFLAAPSPELFDVDTFSDLVRLKDLSANFEQPRFIKWSAFRKTADARYVGLVLPGFLLRPKYNSENSIGLFNYEERFNGQEKGLWGNAAFAFATRLLDSFGKTRWCMDVVGKDNGRVRGLLMSTHAGSATQDKKIPTEILISDRRESELIRWGFIPLSVHKGDDNATFFGASSVQSVDDFSNTDAAKDSMLNAKLGAQLPYLLIVSRFSHYIKMLQREHIGSWKKGPDIEQELNGWIRQYVTDMDNPAPNVRVRRPLRQAKVVVSEVEGKGDWYLISISLTPHLKYMGSHFTLNENAKLDKH